MKPRLTPLLLGTVLALGALTGCSGGSEEPGAAASSTTVPVEQFCAQVDALDSIDTVAQAKKAVAGLGTPEGMPSDAAAGFAAFREALDKVDPDTKAEDFSSVLLEAMGGEDGAAVEKVQAFSTWISQQCGE